MEAAAADFGATYEHRPQLSSTQSTQQRTEEYVNRQIHLLSDTHSVKASIPSHEYAAHNYALYARNRTIHLQFSNRLGLLQVVTLMPTVVLWTNRAAL